MGGIALGATIGVILAIVAVVVGVVGRATYQKTGSKGLARVLMIAAPVALFLILGLIGVIAHPGQRFI